MATLFEECIEALGDEAEIITKKETQALFKKFESVFSFTIGGRINWDLLKNKIEIENVEDIPKFLQDGNNTIFILWDDADYPALKSTLMSVLHVLDDVTAVSFDTWLFAPELGYVIEFYHEGDITLGFF